MAEHKAEFYGPMHGGNRGDYILEKSDWDSHMSERQASDPREIKSRAYAVERLAKRLHWKQEHLDPSDDAVWESHFDKGFFRDCVEWVLMDEEAVLKVLALREAPPLL